MPHRRLIVLAGLVLLGLAPHPAAAQFTSFIPPRKAADSAKAASVTLTKVQTDSVAKMQITNIKTWVDSAAGIAPTQPAAVDSLPAIATAPDTTPAPVMRNGTRAPATASALPAFALAGFGVLLLGVVLLAGPPARARARDGA